MARDESYWAQVQRAFQVDRSMINFNNGGVSPAPVVVSEAVRRHMEHTNQAPAYTMWKHLVPQKEAVRQGFARAWGVDPEEVAFTRNASESLQICQMGLDLKPGDEVLTTTQDYPRMITAFQQRQRREGIRLVQFPLPVPCEDDDAVVRAFETRITDRTRMILMSHVINITGQVLPVRKVVEMARTRGVPVVVDGAHALAHLHFSIADLGCDYYGVSLHKWLFAPIGTGLLYVRKDKVRGLWPLMAAKPEQDDDIRKFEEIGTHPAALSLGIADAVTFHEQIGGARKEARMRYLRDTWANALRGEDRVRLLTSLDPRFSGGIGTVRLEGLDTLKLLDWLWSRHRIFVTAIQHPEVDGLRITPSVYSTMGELGRFIDAMRHACRHGIDAA
ncbi:MAG: aminotransferase class V-fold PLP-dependent enzyme [Phycisphaerae bacterium]|nr:aminotransferase class V-fold PLP-dependent enzyme [Phycisphaerae bacterium]